MKINLATKFTLFRIALIPVLLVVLLFPLTNKEKYLTSLWGVQIYLPHFIGMFIFIIAAITDAIDGYIARSRNMITNLGKFLDPIADKLLVNTLLIYLAYTNNIPVILTILMIARDTIVDALRLIAVENNIVIAASIYGKLKTVFQMITITLLLLFTIPFENSNIYLVILTYITTVVSLLSGIDYLMKNYKSIKD